MASVLWYLLEVVIVVVAAGLLPLLPGLFKLMPAVAILVVVIAEATRP